MNVWLGVLYCQTLHYAVDEVVAMTELGAELATELMTLVTVPGTDVGYPDSTVDTDAEALEVTESVDTDPEAVETVIVEIEPEELDAEAEAAPVQPSSRALAIYRARMTSTSVFSSARPRASHASHLARPAMSNIDGRLASGRLETVTALKSA